MRGREKIHAVWMVCGRLAWEARDILCVHERESAWKGPLFATCCSMNGAHIGCE